MAKANCDGSGGLFKNATDKGNGKFEGTCPQCGAVRTLTDDRRMPDHKPIKKR